MRDEYVIAYPRNQVILKCPFYHLMEQIWRYHLVDIRPREVCCKRLASNQWKRKNALDMCQQDLTMVLSSMP